MNDLDKINTKNLYHWIKPNNKYDSKLNSKIKESENIQSIHQWLRKVEEASENAISKVLNPKPETKSLTQNKKNSNSNLKLFDLDERKNLNEIIKKPDPYSEAHDLINEWITDKIRFDLDDDFYNYVDVTEMNKFSNNQKVLDKLKNELMDQDESSNTNNSILDIKGIDYDKYDESYIAKDILNKMVKKNFVDPVKLYYSDENKNKNVNTQLRIELRHQAVKENREKRLKELEQRRKEKLEKKEIELKAKQMVLKEENDKKLREELEKQLIEQEAQKLRLEMAEQRKRDEENRKRQKELEQIRIEREKQEILNNQKKLELSNENELENKRNEIAEKRANELVESFLKIKNMRILQKSFSNWYGIILDLRIKNGKAKALADWKLSYKVFNGWKKISITEKVKKEQEIHQVVIRNENIKNVKAANFYNSKLLLKFFEEWKKFTKSELLLKQIELDKQKTKSRMQRFLEAAKEGKLANLQDQDLEKEPITTRSNKSNFSNKNDLKKSKSFESLDNIDKKPIKNNNFKLQSRLNSSRNTNRSQMSSSRTDLNNQTKKNDVNIDKKVKEMMWPWAKSPYIVNNFDNRFKAQEKLLNEQTKMIKEQQKLIEDLKYQQSQVAFKEQIALLEEIKAKQLELERMQKIQYKQEKKLLRKQSELVNNTKNNKKKENANEIKKEDSKSSSILSSDESEELKIEKEEITKNEIQETFRTNQTIADTSLISNQSNQTNQKWDQFNKNMIERAKLREQQKKEREDKRKKLELEKLELIKAQQEEKLKVEEEEKKKKAEELREKKRIQQKLEEKRNAEKLKEQQKIEKADEFYRKYLLRYYGMNGFKKLVNFRNSNLEKAEKFYNLKMYKLILTEWRLIVRAELSVKEKRADEFHKKLLIKNAYFIGIKQFKQFLQIEMAKASRFYKYHIKFKLFKAWKLYSLNEQEKFKSYEIMITEHNLIRIKTIHFRIWRQYPAELKREKARQKRLEELRSKVKELIPDYKTPNSIDSMSNKSINTLN